MPPHTADDDTPDRLSRRTTLVRAGGLAAAALGAGSLSAEAATTGRTGAVACVLTPEMTERPYYVAGEKVRRTISEGLPGAPMALRLRVLDASTCKPIKGAAVDIWHCSAGGTYSGVEANDSVGKMFLRGIQLTDAKGLAQFKTVCPGWYQGRTAHIHVKVHVGGDAIHTGQLFFRDGFTDAVYKRAPYRARGARDVRNADDSIYASGGSRSLLSMQTIGKGYVGSFSMGVNRT